MILATKSHGELAWLAGKYLAQRIQIHTYGKLNFGCKSNISEWFRCHLNAKWS